MLFYDKAVGEAETYEVNNDGSIKLHQKHTGWRKSWDIIQPVGINKNFLLFYDKDLGEGEIYSKGNLQLMISGGWRKTWTDIVQIGRRIVFFDKNSSEFEVYEINTYKGFKFKKLYGGKLEGTFESVISLTHSSLGQLLFYDKKNGKGITYDINYDKLIKSCEFNNWRKSWSQIICSDYDISCLK